MGRLLIFLMVCLPLLVNAQSEAYWSATTQARTPSGAFVNTVLAPQGSAGGSPSSIVRVGQNGNNNAVNFGVTGSGNDVTMSQSGTANAINFTLTGSTNVFNLEQTGNENQLLLRDIRLDNGNVAVQQLGDRNVLEKEGNSFTPGVPMRIEQTGGMQLRIRNGQ